MFFHHTPNFNSHQQQQPKKKSYYEILGIEPNSSPLEIKTAYRKLSLKYHPDRNNQPGSQSVFQELGEAYETLGDADKKKQYDMEQQHPTANINGVDINDLFNAIFADLGKTKMDSRPGIQIIRQGVNGGVSSSGGSMGRGGLPHGLDEFINSSFNIPKPNIQPIQQKVNITIEQAYNGCNIPIEIERVITFYNEQKKESETIYINIPQGIDNNENIVIQGKGHIIDGISGDIRIIIQVINQSPFQRNGLELIYKKTISLKEALLGFSFDLQHLNGKIYTFSNSTQIIGPYFKRKIPSLGMIRETNCGNLYIEFIIQFPEKLTETQIASLNEIL
jgi:DnaJ-class molecular chaperone